MILVAAALSIPALRFPISIVLALAVFLLAHFLGIALNGRAPSRLNLLIDVRPIGLLWRSLPFAKLPFRFR